MVRSNSKRLAASQSKKNQKIVDDSSDQLNKLKNILDSNSNYSVPTEIIDLPSKGNFYKEDSPLRGIEAVEIKHLTAKEEDILSNSDFIMRGLAFDKLLDSIVVDSSFDHRKMLPGDRNALLVAARVAAYGAKYGVEMPCHDCNRNVEFYFDLSTLASKEICLEELGVREDDGVYYFTLPKCDLEVGIKILDSDDEEFLKKQKEKQDKLGIDSFETIEYLRRILVSAAGVQIKSQLNEFAALLPAIDARKIKNVYAKLVPGLDFSQMATCPKCESESRREVPFTATFFWPDI